MAVDLPARGAVVARNDEETIELGIEPRQLNESLEGPLEVEREKGGECGRLTVAAAERRQAQAAKRNGRALSEAFGKSVEVDVEVMEH